jgi:hypothetical protein
VAAVSLLSAVAAVMIRGRLQLLPSEDR